MTGLIVTAVISSAVSGFLLWLAWPEISGLVKDRWNSEKQIESDIEKLFLEEVERRAGASREEMLKSVSDERAPNCCDVSEWLGRILGGDND